jgi:hypothetical protein
MKYILLIFILLTLDTYSQNNNSTNTDFQKKEDACSDIKIETDKFTGEVNYDSPTIENISFIKTKSKGITRQYVSLRIYDSFLSGSNTGVIILFKSGKKINRPNEKIDLDNASNADYRYSAFFAPTASEANLLKSEEIVGFKLYIFDTDITQGSIIKSYANCVLVGSNPSVNKKK